MSEGTDTDYWFLRNNGLNAKTALRILAIAYKTEERLGEGEKVGDEAVDKRDAEMQEEEFYGVLNRCSGVSK